MLRAGLVQYGLGQAANPRLFGFGDQDFKHLLTTVPNDWLAWPIMAVPWLAKGWVGSRRD
jgi:hypothetical protein